MSPLNSPTHFNYLHCQFKPHNNNFPCLGRVCTDFWIQNFFGKQKLIFSFPDSRLSNRWSLDTLKNTKQSFVHDLLQTYRWDWIRFDQKEKKFTYTVVVVALKKVKAFNHFFQTFSRSRKLPGKFQDFFKNSRLCANPACVKKCKGYSVSCLILLLFKEWMYLILSCPNINLWWINIESLPNLESFTK